jgi:hypothetical protein
MLALGVLATWRVTHLLAREDGPGHVVLRLRVRLGSGRLGDLMDCFLCLSFWVAAPPAVLLVRGRREALVAWLGLSGAACLLERATSDPAVSPLPMSPERPGP